MDSTDSQIARVKQKLAQLQANWQTRLNEFGVPNEFSVEKHQFRMNATLSEDDLRAFETDHGIRLPEDYRAFLYAIGNGGAGPYSRSWPTILRTTAPFFCSLEQSGRLRVKVICSCWQ